VSIAPLPKPDPSAPPTFTAKQGQYLAYIYYYSKIHRQAPAEAGGTRRRGTPRVGGLLKGKPGTDGGVHASNGGTRYPSGFQRLGTLSSVPICPSLKPRYSKIDTGADV